MKRRALSEAIKNQESTKINRFGACFVSQNVSNES